MRDTPAYAKDQSLPVCGCGCMPANEASTATGASISHDHISDAADDLTAAGSHGVAASPAGDQSSGHNSDESVDGELFGSPLGCPLTATTTAQSSTHNRDESVDDELFGSQSSCMLTATTTANR